MTDFYHEETFWRQGIDTVIGIDEVGRGSLAGPVVAGACCLKDQIFADLVLRLGIDDSKRLKAMRRMELSKIIKKYFQWGIGEADVIEINRWGIVRATGRAMRRALKNFQFPISNFQNNQKYFMLVDGFPVKYLPGGLKRQTAIIRGDQKSVTIAAASIIAKVYRDRLMIKLAREYPDYKWERNKGYGTGFHRRIIIKNGISLYHREKFIGGIKEE